jgi:ribosomal protein S18 acetylase RimI-like enzyme
MASDADLYRRGNETLVPSWEAYARGTPGAAVMRLPGVTAAVFPAEPERFVYNNALLERPRRRRSNGDHVCGGRGHALRRLGARERDGAAQRSRAARLPAQPGDAREAMVLEDVRLPRPRVELGSVDWDEYLRIFGLPPGLLSSADRSAFRVLVARLDGENVATAMAFDHGSDTGIYNVGTLERARRRALGTALTALHVADATARMNTASFEQLDQRRELFSCPAPGAVVVRQPVP